MIKRHPESIRAASKIGLSKIDYVCIALIALSFIAAFNLYPAMPDSMPTHWNAAGDVDGYGSKFVGVFLIPLITAILFGFFLIIPKIEVFKENLNSFRLYFDYIKLAFVVFMLGIWAAALWQLRRPFNMSYFIVPAIAALFYLIGWTMKKAKRNYFVGIRTPWTLASENVWDKTHKLGSLTFRLNALLMLPAMLNARLFMWFFILPLLANVIFLYVYSYVVWKKETHK